jgi:hypothetical protein
LHMTAVEKLPVAETGDGSASGRKRRCQCTIIVLAMVFLVIAVGRGFSGGHESCCTKNPDQRRGLRRVIVGGRCL